MNIEKELEKQELLLLQQMQKEGIINYFNEKYIKVFRSKHADYQFNILPILLKRE